MDSTNILFNSILSLKHNNDINQEEIDTYYYEKGDEIKFIFTPDQGKIANNFAEDIYSLKAKLARCGLAYNLDTVKENSEIITNISYINVKPNSKLVKKHTLYKEISYKEGQIYSTINNKEYKLKKDRKEEYENRIDKGQVYKIQIQNIEEKIEGLEIPIKGVKEHIKKYGGLALKGLKDGDTEKFYNNFHKLKSTYKELGGLYASFRIIDIEGIKQSILKIENHKAIEYDEIKREILHIGYYFLEDIEFKVKGFKNELRKLKYGYKCFKESSNTIKGIYLKSNQLDNNNKIFNDLSVFVNKYLSDYYDVKENLIKLKDNNKTEILNFKIIDNLEDFSIKNTYFYTTKQTTFNTYKTDFIDNKKNKIDFFTKFIFQRSYTGAEHYDNDIKEQISREIKYFSVKDSIINTNFKSFNNENNVYLEKTKFNKHLSSYKIPLNIKDFGNLFYIIKDDNNKSDKIYYSIRDSKNNNISNHNKIKELLKEIIFKGTIYKKIEKDYESQKDKIKIPMIKYINYIYNGLNNFILTNGIPIIGFTITGRKDISKGTSSSTSLFKLYKKTFGTSYTDFYKNTKDNIYSEINGKSSNYFDIDYSYLKKEFEKCISKSFESLKEKVDDKIKKHCKEETYIFEK